MNDISTFSLLSPPISYDFSTFRLFGITCLSPSRVFFLCYLLGSNFGPLGLLCGFQGSHLSLLGLPFGPFWLPLAPLWFLWLPSDSLSFLLVLFWLRFDSHLAPFGFFLAQFGFPLIFFWFPLALFWLPLASLASFRLSFGYAATM